MLRCGYFSLVAKYSEAGVRGRGKSMQASQRKTSLLRPRQTGAEGDMYPADVKLKIASSVKCFRRPTVLVH